MSELASRELSFTPAAIQVQNGAAGAEAGADNGPGSTLASHALDSPGQDGLSEEASVTFPVLAARDSGSDSQAVQQQQLKGAQLHQQEERQDPQSLSALQGKQAQQQGGSNGITLQQLRSSASASELQSRGRLEQQQPGHGRHSEGAPRPQHTSASPCRWKQGRFTIIET